jgi:tetraacyldisaccharide 4'-kinase
MKPSFPARRLLLPLVPLYRSALVFRELRLRFGLEPVRRLRWPVVSIGNLSTGGSGKTPLTIALAKALTGRGLRVDALSRGYGRENQLAALVNPEGTAEEFGDEPLLIARETGIPVYVAAQRYDAGLLAEAEAQQSAGAGRQTRVHLLDDGFQHRQLARNVDILLLDRRDWQDRLLPAGNRREPLKAARRASVIAIPANEPALEGELRRWGWKKPVWQLRRIMEIPNVDGPVAVFCGIARPEQFFAGIEAAGFKIALWRTFPDHHRYTARELGRLAASARAAGVSALVTTEKDLVRLGNLASTLPKSLPLRTARLRIEIENQAAAIDWLLGRLEQVVENKTIHP